jgi:uncharacterized CHY-type Zn-finger protein
MVPFHAATIGAERMKRSKDTEHLVRLAVIFICGVVVFLVARSFLVPQSFGKYGHFRADALGVVAARPVAFAGRELCEACHPEVVALKTPGRHKGVSCEACHGPLQKHADDPGTIVPPKLNAEVLCVKCHEAISAKPVTFPQIASKDHYPGMACDICHQPHSPHLDAGGKK